MLSMSSLNMLLAKNDFLPSPLKKTYVVSRFLSLLLWFRMPQDLLDLIEMRQRVLNPLNEEFSIFMELLGYLCIKEEEREFQKCSSQFSSVQLLSHIRLFVTPFTAASQASLSITNSWSLLKFMSIELVMPSNHLILCCPHLLSHLFHARPGAAGGGAQTAVLLMKTPDPHPQGLLWSCCCC